MKTTPFFLMIALLVCSCGPGRNVSSSNDTNTYSSTKIKVDNTAVTYKDIYEYLQGKVPGVEIVGTSIRIRGLSTPTGNPDALVILDGMEVSDVSDVNPADIASVEVLKDSESTLYGMRGANGVVIITTKKAGDD
jgi:TonB-dependent SusC/RagA subfamily outer membrane receptor